MWQEKSRNAPLLVLRPPSVKAVALLPQSAPGVFSRVYGLVPLWADQGWILLCCLCTAREI